VTWLHRINKTERKQSVASPAASEDLETTGSALQNTHPARALRTPRIRGSTHKRRVQARTRWVQADKLRADKNQKLEFGSTVCKPAP